MSIDIKWDTFTSGPDGEVLAEKIRAFIHEKFQQVTLPRFIRSVQVHSFDFGKACPDLEIKDICDPLPDFYEEDEDDSDVEQPAEPTPTAVDEHSIHRLQDQLNSKEKTRRGSQRPASIYPTAADPRLQSLHSPFGLSSQMGNPFRSPTPGIPGGTSNLSYFHLPYGGISGTQTPLAAVASGTPFQSNWHDQSSSDGHTEEGRVTNPPSQTGPGSPASRPSTAATIPMSPESLVPVESIGSSAGLDAEGVNELSALDSPSLQHMTERRPEDIQVVCRVKYSGDVRMTLTAEILLDYPMPSFVGIPLKLSITGLKFDGVAILAYIRKKAHFCFLSPEDAHALVGHDEENNINDGSSSKGTEGSQPDRYRSFASLLQEIEVESEIGKKENGKQVLKNVSKVEKFVLEQVRRIFEEEFVFPSYWTFLV